LSLSTVGGSSSQTRATSQPIRQIDHIMIGTGDPRELYAFFVETLQLPIGWPMTRLRTGVMTGGVGFGNANVDAIRADRFAAAAARLALEPSALDERACGEVAPLSHSCRPVPVRPARKRGARLIAGRTTLSRLEASSDLRPDRDISW
jgi:hypothetical protein